MSQENVETCRQGLEAWQRGDFESWLGTTDPAVEWHTVLERLVEGTNSFYRGHEGLRALWHSYRTELEDFQIEAQELRDVDDDRVLLLGHLRWRGVASGIEVESPLAMVLTYRDGRLIQSMDYLSHQEALDAVALSE
jgi:ketosteroid isomerase-like protein